MAAARRGHMEGNRRDCMQVGEPPGAIRACARWPVRSAATTTTITTRVVPSMNTLTLAPVKAPEVPYLRLGHSCRTHAPATANTPTRLAVCTVATHPPQARRCAYRPARRPTPRRHEPHRPAPCRTFASHNDTSLVMISRACSANTSSIRGRLSAAAAPAPTARGTAPAAASNAVTQRPVRKVPRQETATGWMGWCWWLVRDKCTAPRNQPPPGQHSICTRPPTGGW